jgi:hypothetical protein
MPTPRVETETHGWLIPANESVGSACLGRGRALLFVAGRNGFRKITNERSTVLAIDDVVVLSAERSSGRDEIAFYGDIRDTDGYLVGHIEKNEFNLVSSRLSYRKRSPDGSKLSVFDPRGKELLYIDYANPHTVVIRGVFTAANGTEIVVNDDEIVINDGAHIWGNCIIGPDVGFRFTNGNMHM